MESITMGFDNILPLVIIWLIWRFFSKAKGRPDLEEIPVPGVGSPDHWQDEEPHPFAVFRRPEEIMGREMEPVTPEVKETSKPFFIEEVAAPVKIVRPPAVVASLAVRPESRSRLQQAVIWAEILGPPVAWRD